PDPPCDPHVVYPVAVRVVDVLGPRVLAVDPDPTSRPDVVVGVRDRVRPALAEARPLPGTVQLADVLRPVVGEEVRLADVALARVLPDERGAVTARVLDPGVRHLVVLRVAEEHAPVEPTPSDVDVRYLH